MLDAYVKPYTDPIFEKVAHPFSAIGIPSTALSLIGFVVALCGCFTVGMGNYITGLILILLGRGIDALAVSTARTLGTGTDFGDYLRVILEWTLYAAFVFIFAFSLSAHTVAATFLLLSFLLIAISGLAYKVIAAKRGQIDDELSYGMFHPARFVERTEILIFMILCCLIPAYFSGFAVIMAVLGLATTGGWIFKASRNF